MTDGDEPEKWLVDSGASSHFSPFIHLFLNLIPYEPIRILTGNGYITSGFKGAIPLIIKVGMKSEHILLENVLFVPSLKSRVNLFVHLYVIFFPLLPFPFPASNSPFSLL